MSDARIVFGDDVVYNSQTDIVRAMQAVFSALHRDGIGYQVRIGGSEGERSDAGFSTVVLLVGPSNPPRFEYADTSVPDISEPFENLVWNFSAKALHERMVDLTIIRDAVDRVNNRASEE